MAAMSLMKELMDLLRNVTKWCQIMWRVIGRNVVFWTILQERNDRKTNQKKILIYICFSKEILVSYNVYMIYVMELGPPSGKSLKKHARWEIYIMQQ